MNLEDESLLSAYLDDELDAPRRVEVEEALRSDPRLTGRLRELGEARDLIAGLGRPAAPAGLADAVLARLDRRPAFLPSLVSRTRSLPAPFLLGAGASLAAGVVIALSLTLPAGQHGDAPKREPLPGPVVQLDAPANRPRMAPDAAPAPAPSSPPAEKTKELLGRDVAALRDGIESVRLAVTPATSLQADKQPADAALAPGSTSSSAKREVAASKAAAQLPDADFAFSELGEDEGKAELTAMLGRPGVRRMMVVADVIDARTIEAFDGAVKDARRKHPRQIRVEIGQGVVTDPDHPEGRGIIFAMAMDDSERERLHRALEKTIPGARIDEDLAPPAVTTKLSREIGKFQVSDGDAVAGLLDTPPGLIKNQFAMKTEPNNAVDAPARRKAADEQVKPDQSRGLYGASDLAKDKAGAGVADQKASRKGEEIMRDRDKPNDEGVPSVNGALGGATAPMSRQSKAAAKPAGPPPSLAVKEHAKGKDQRSDARRPEDEPDTVLVWLIARTPK